MMHFCSLPSVSKCIHSLFPINPGFLFNLLMILWGKSSHFINCEFETTASKTHQIPIQRTSEELKEEMPQDERRWRTAEEASSAQEVTQPTKPQVA